MKTAFEQRLRHVQLRCHGNLLLEKLAWSLAAAGAAAALAATAERFLGVGVFRLWGLSVLAAMAALAAVAAAALWYRRRPSLLHVAVLIDREMGLKERMSTSLALAQSRDPFAQAARREAHQAAEKIDLKGKFPLRLSRRWFWPLLSWSAVAAILLFLPPLDLLGRDRAARSQQDEKRQLQQARDEVKQAIERIDMTVRQLADASLSAELAKAGDAKDAMKPDDVKHQAIRKLSELSEQIKKAEGSPKMEAVKTLGDMLKGIRSPAASLLPELNRDIAKGDFKHAAEQIREIQKQIEQGKLTQEQQEALAKQLSELGKQVEQQADKNKDLQDELEKAGLDKDLASLSEQDFKDALQKQEGLSQEKIDELLRKAEACRKACEACKGLGKALCGCCAGGGDAEGEELSPEELANLLEAVEGIEGEAEGLASMEASLDEIERELALLSGGASPFREGLSLRRGPGTGSPGIGMGPRKTDPTGQTALEKTRVEGQTKESPTVASWYFKGPQVKGESQKQLQQVIQAGRDVAAEAISENEIPRKYEAPMKRYFGDLEETSQEPNR